MCVCVCLCHTKQPHILLTPADRLQPAREAAEPVAVEGKQKKPVESLEPPTRTELLSELRPGCTDAHAGRIRLEG